jgi:signal transduction histidine kinase
VVGVRADIRGGQRTVLVATDLARVLDSSRLLGHILLIAGPVVVIMMAALTWWIVGLALRPVNALRRGAAELSATGLSRSRLPIPVAEDEIYSLALTLNDMLDRLDKANTKQRRFVGDAAHELRSPIASLRVQLEVAERTLGSPEVHELTKDALIDVDRLSRLIDDLLALARSDERGGLTSRAPVRLDDLVTEVLASYQEQPVTALSLAPVIAIGDRSGLHRVLVNLIDNAVRYAASRVEVEVRASEEDWICLSVSDDGPGIPSDKRERVFDRFYRLDTARSRDAGGTGLGLSIVREIVDAHGGMVQLADNRPGLTVRVLLPRHSS